MTRSLGFAALFSNRMRSKMYVCRKHYLNIEQNRPRSYITCFMLNAMDMLSAMDILNAMEREIYIAH